MPHLATLHPTHTGQLRPHHHTTYLPLLVFLIVVGIILTTCTSVAWTRPGPSEGYVGVSGTVPSKPPTQAARILSPTTGTRIAKTPVTVSGTCPANTLVEVFKNKIFAGSSQCTKEGTFSFEIDLLFGKNDLMARVYDALNQAGPDSNIVTVFYDALPAQAGAASSLGFGGPQLLVNTDAVFRGSFPKESMSVPVEVIGGRAPYAINVQWGDGTNKVVPRSDNTPFRTSHSYAQAGTYSVSLQASDADGRVAFLTVAAIINGQPASAAAGTTPQQSSFALQSLLMLWPLYAGILTAVISFWIGERREKRLLQQRGLLVHTG